MRDNEVASERDQGSPEVLPYGQPRRRFVLSRRQQMGFIAGGIGLAIMVTADRTIERISCHECCTTCGANSSVRYIEVGSKRFEHPRYVFQGPFSKLIEKTDGQPCHHIWVFSSGNWHSLLGLSGVRVCGGNSYGRADALFRGDYAVAGSLGGRDRKG